MVSTVLAQILRSGREHFNSRFSAARRLQPDLDAQRFSAFLAEAVDPLVQAVERVAPSRTTEVAMVAYDVALELAAQRLLAAGAPAQQVSDGWRRALGGVPTLVAAEPARLLGATANAVHALASTAGARPEQWLELMERLGAKCTTADEWLKYGQVAAWRAGLAHFRTEALGLANTLSESAALALVGASSGTRWTDVRARLAANVWFDPARPAPPDSRVCVAAYVGAFRGFGGLFIEPPRVVAVGEHLLVSSGDEAWVLTADAFGATFHRANPDEKKQATGMPVPAVRWRMKGVRFEWGEHEVELPDLGEPASVAFTASTVALTSRFTHRVVLVAVPSR